jgi:predicted DsbA family dithiol-disulfide isomerase
MTTITLYFDFQCPFAYRGVHLLSEIEQTRPDITLRWRFLSLEQNAAVKRGRGEDWTIWEQPLAYPTLWRRRRQRSLAPFLASYAASKQGAEASSRFRLAVFQAYHEEGQDTSSPDVLLDLARQTGLELNAFQTEWQSDNARKHLQEDHLSSKDVGAFGVPMIIIDDCEATYLRLSSYPVDGAERQRLFDELMHLMTRRPYVQELKRASAYKP